MSIDQKQLRKQNYWKGNSFLEYDRKKLEFFYYARKRINSVNVKNTLLHDSFVVL